MYFKNKNEMMKNISKRRNESAIEYMIFVGQDSKGEIEDIIQEFNDIGIKFFGGVYPRIISNGKTYSKGYVLKEIQPVYSEIIFPGKDIDISKLHEESSYTGIIIGDGFSDRNGELIKTVENILRGNINCIGGGSALYSNNLGIYNLEQDYSVFNNRGIFKDVFYLCIIEEWSKTEVKFGWEILDGPFKVTKSDKNLICELHGDKAFDFYKYKLENLQNIYIREEDFVIYSSTYTFAIIEDGEIRSIRVPIEVTEEGYIRVVNPVQKGSEFYIVKANKPMMLKAVEDIESTIDKIERFKETDINEMSLIFSCITRYMLLDREFEREVKAIDRKGLYKAEGAVTIGEFSNSHYKNKLSIYEGACTINRINHH